ncbi:hypothetical protein LAUMK13_02960 [Mycobacterium innocens]|uniref:PE domain-containing protein n=1 Tax=Mycobacterium innocens TaxID=2341083 RepID=A0A498Q2X7_9MYCO|nr:hypothetical protein LAUMK13_02960 [Mycobacterium innocens]
MSHRRPCNHCAITDRRCRPARVTGSSSWLSSPGVAFEGLADLGPTAYVATVSEAPGPPPRRLPASPSSPDLVIVDPLAPSHPHESFGNREASHCERRKRRNAEISGPNRRSVIELIRFTDAPTTWQIAMSYLAAVPELLASAATDLSDIGSALVSANAAAVAPTIPWRPLPVMKYQRPLPRCSPAMHGSPRPWRFSLPSGTVIQRIRLCRGKFHRSCCRR